MNKKNLVVLLFAFFFLLNFVSAMDIQLAPLDDNGFLLPYDSFNYSLIFSNSAACSSPVLTVNQIVTTNQHGYAYINFSTSSLSSSPSYLCEYRNSTLKNVHSLSDNVFTSIIADTITADTFIGSGNGLTDVPRTFQAKINYVGGINKGQAVYVSGASNDQATISLADNQVPQSSHTLAIAGEDGNNGDIIDIYTDGTLLNVNTSRFTEGCLLHLGTGNDNIQCDSAPNGSHVHIGFATKIDGTTGIIFVSTQEYYHYFSGTPGNTIDIYTGADTNNYINFADYNKNSIGKMYDTGTLAWLGNISATNFLGTYNWTIASGSENDLSFDGNELNFNGSRYYDLFETATPSNGDTSNISTADQIYDWVIGLNYLNITEIINDIGNWSSDKPDYMKKEADSNLNMSDYNINNVSNITADYYFGDIGLGHIGNGYGTETLLELLEETLNSGVLQTITITDTGVLTFNWSNGEIYDAQGLELINIISGSGSCTDNSITYLVWKEGTSLGVYTSSADVPAGEIDIGHVHCQDGDILSVHHDSIIVEREMHMSHALDKMFPIVVTDGLILTELPGVNLLDVQSSGGIYFHAGHNEYTPSYISSNDTDIQRHFKTAGEWDSDLNSQIDSTTWNNGTDLIAMQNSKYFRSQFIIDSNNIIHWIYPDVEYGTSAECVDGISPVTPQGLEHFPSVMDLCLQEGDTEFPVASSNQWIDTRITLSVTAAAASGVTDYNSLTSLPDLTIYLNETYANTLYRNDSWDNFTGIPTATPSNGDINHLSTADQIYDWVVSLFMQDLVDDTTPQLGGNLDANGYNLTLSTNVYINLGNTSMVDNGTTFIISRS